MTGILIVSDRTRSAAELQRIVREMRHSVVDTAMSAETALRIAVEQNVSIAFIDITLGRGRDAIQLAADLRDKTRTRVIFATAQADSDIIAQAESLRPDGYVLEPFTVDAVFNALSAALDKTRRASVMPTDLEQLSEISVSWKPLPAPTMSKIEEYVQSTLDGEITLKGLADLSGMSESSFSRRFKVTKGVTPYQYVMHARLAQAKRLLRETDLPLVDIAVATGFSSQSHFATTFKKAVKLTPLQFRRA